MSLCLVTASRICDAAGDLLVSGRAIFRVVDGNGNPITARTNNGGQITLTPVVGAVINGVLSQYVVDVSLLSPSYPCIELTIINNADDSVVWYDRTLQPIGAGFSLDNYAQSTTPVVPLQGGQSVPGNLTVNGSLSVTGGLSVGGFTVGAMLATTINASGTITANALSAASISASGTVTAATLAATAAITAPAATISGKLTTGVLEGSGAAPAVSVNVTATGAGYSVSLQPGSNGLAGQIVLTTGPSGQYVGAVLILTLTSGTAAPNRQVLVVTPANTAAAACQSFAGAANATQAQLDTNVGLAANTQFIWNYTLVQV